MGLVPKSLGFAFIQRNSIGINRRGYSGCGGWEKIVGELKAGNNFERHVWHV